MSGIPLSCPYISSPSNGNIVPLSPISLGPQLGLASIIIGRGSTKITGTPSLMVNGKYRIDTRKAGSQANMLKIADYLVAKERAARGS